MPRNSMMAFSERYHSFYLTNKIGKSYAIVYFNTRNVCAVISSVCIDGACIITSKFISFMYFNYNFFFSTFQNWL